MIELEQRDFIKTLQEEVLSRKIGQNPVLETKSEETPAISEIAKDTDYSHGNAQVNQFTNDDNENDNSDGDEIAPQNYFF
jgi:hypothetical protein